MSSSLDKLKALTSLLEDKLEQKEKPSIEEKKTAKEIPEHAKKTSAITPLPQKKEKKIVTSTPKRVEKKYTATSEDTRSKNINRVKILYDKLKIFEKSPDFKNIFMYKAMNLSGIGLKEEDFGEVREGKYIQIIAITYEPDKNGKKKAKNISLGYFGKAETLDIKLKNEIIEFVLRWRYEKAFQNVEHYKDLIARVDVPKDTLF